MSLTHLSSTWGWSSSPASLSPSADDRRAGEDFYGKQRPTNERRSASSSIKVSGLVVICRSSDGSVSRRSNGYSSSSGGGSYAVENAGGGRGNRANGRYRGGGRGGRGRGRGRGRAGDASRRRDRPKQMHPGAYQMRDEQTGDMVVVWGVEGDDDIPMPSAADLNWKQTTVALPGDASDEIWTKRLEEESGSPGGFRVRGAELVRKGTAEELTDGESEGDLEDDVLDELEDNDYDEESGSSDSEGLRDSPRVSIVRAPRVKVFGRDMWGKPQGKVKSPKEIVLSDKEEITNVGSKEIYFRRTKASSDPVNGDTSASNSRLHEGLPVVGTRGPDPNEEDIVEWRRRKSFEKGSAQTSTATRMGEKGVEWAGAAKVGDVPSERNRSAESKDKWIDERSRSRKSVDLYPPKGRGTTIKDELADSGSKAVPGSFIPYIIDVTEEDDSHRQPKDQHGESSGTLLERLRLQVVARNPTAEDRGQKVLHVHPEESSLLKSKSWNLDRSVSQSSSDDSGQVPLRDVTARDNYDASIADEFFSTKTFNDIGATAQMVQALSYLNVQRPSQIQAMSFKPILEGKSCILAEQTGSGKTLAYAAPIVQGLKAEEGERKAGELAKLPRALVLVPTGELAAQVLTTFRSLSKGGVPCRSIVITGGFKWKTQVESLKGGADVVVATPGRLLQHLEAGNILFDNLKCVVFDEVDILFDDEDFSKALQTINRSTSIKVQYIHVTATLPVDIHDDLVERYPDCLSLMGPSLHRTAAGLQEILVDCSGGEADEKTPDSAFANKKAALLQLVQERRVSKTIVFCNKLETCRKVENVLSRHDRAGKTISVLPYHAALSHEAQVQNLETFMKSQSEKSLFLVCTDRASRGIDSLDVEHVILFDFPRDPSEYVRRVGRTARGAGGTGRVFVFVVGRQVGLARRIMARNDKGEPVHDVPGGDRYYSN